MSTATQIPQVPPFEYRDLTGTQRARLANTDPKKHRSMKEAWEKAGRPAARPVTSAALIRAGWAHDGLAFRDMTCHQRAKLKRENEVKYEALKRQWTEAGCPAPESNGPLEAA